MRTINGRYRRVVEGFCLFLFLLLASCAIENDIPYPVVNGSVTDIRVEGQRPAEGSSDTAAVIDASAKTILLYVNDSVDISRLKLTRLVVNPNDAEVLVDSTLCENSKKFPFTGFSSLDSIPMSSNTRMNFTNPVNFTIKTYQEYVWQVTVRQIIDRKIEVEGMIDYSIDEFDSRVTIYVGKEQDLEDIHITSLALGGAYGEVTPDPTTVKDFTSPQKFTVQYAWNEPNKGTIWTVYVRLTDEDGGSKPSTGDLSVNAWSKYADVEGKASETDCSFEYVKQGETSWNKVSAKTDGTKVSARIEELQPGTTYQCRLVNASGSVLGESSFTTEDATALYNGDFDLWYQAGKTWYAGESGKSFWDTSNPGTTQGLGAVVNINPTQGNSNVVHTQGGKSAELKSQWKVKFAAASLYTGSFGELVGMSGAKINFGRPFTSRPTALHGFFQYAPATVGYVGDNQPAGTITKGDPDVCSIYIALAKKAYVVDNTDTDTFIKFKEDNDIIAYGELPIKECVSTNGTWKEFTIDLEYKTQEKPGNMYIIIVASASKYGDYFTGGDGSILYVDDFELIYD
ncbi:PCMD domain-containing protein [uncultured Parabacteroides sp.]|uniref:PCMD domain-containing protein n=1 Tax=uncultured Parabacteroides sp. TaxID=512312 RepID=UPI00261C6CCA|nr:PCMD domain-containing protein [uncultured Parabacteroides sp.]